MTRLLSIAICFAFILLITAQGLQAKPEKPIANTSQHNPQYNSDGFQLALPGYKYSFPRDHGAHERFKTEWWYTTGHLETENKKKFGYELTFFRVGNGSKMLPNNANWKLKNLYMAHLALSDENGKKFFHTAQFNRNALNRAGARHNRLETWNQRWRFTQQDDKTFLLNASTEDFGFELTLKRTKPVVIHGKKGISKKANCTGCASHYYSMPHMNTTGILTYKGKKQPVKGLSWMDHEFGSSQLTKNQTGWDWFSVQLDNNKELMLYQLRTQDGTPDANSSGTFIEGTGKYHHLALKDFTVKPTAYWTSPHSGAKYNHTYPMGWKVSLPSKKISLKIVPVFHDQELYFEFGQLPTYWEGACKVSGTMSGKPVSGQAYVEMTGYDKAFSQGL